MRASFRIFVAFVVAMAIAGAAGAQSSGTLFTQVPPIGPGGYPVACSNVEQDFSRVAANASASDYWEGDAGYVTDLLTDSADAFVVDVTLPNDVELFGDFGGRTMPFAALVCYPTSAANTRADYALPNGKAVPRMQRDGQLPIFPDDTSRFPVLLFSHGLGGSPLSNDYIDALTLFASYGYVVIAPFHGDARVSSISISTLGDVLNALLHFSNYTALQSIRPFALRAELDALLADPGFAPHVDSNAIGGFGASLGGESLLLMRGARLTVSPGLSSKTVMNDARLKAAVGYVPYFGQPILPAFGRNQEGLHDVQMPYLAIAGSADVTAPAAMTALGMSQLTGVRQYVLLAGVQHGFDVRFASDIFTWALTFLDAYVENDPLARATSARMTNVQGGGDDALLLDRFLPLPPAPGQALAIEYYDPALDHYFMTADSYEVAVLDTQTIPGWYRTGDAFKVYVPGASSGVPACRFFGRPGVGPNSHFFTILPNECADVLANPLWIFEGLVFRVDAPDAAETCPADRVPVVRMYNNGKGGQANHRYLTSHSEIAAMLAQGWIIEGTVFCSLP
jgi:predicted dienelactone hydrolase